MACSLNIRETAGDGQTQNHDQGASQGRGRDNEEQRRMKARNTAWAFFWFAAWVFVASILRHEMVSSAMIGFLLAGNGLAGIHRAGHQGSKWWSEPDGNWRMRMPRSLYIYRQQHLAHHRAESAYGDDFTPEGLKVRKTYRVTPASVWAFILAGHAVIAMLLGAAFGWIMDLSWQQTMIVTAFGWIGAILFYAWYELVHFVTHRDDFRTIVITLFGSTMHRKHHESPATFFGIYSPLNMAEHVPMPVLRLGFTIFGMLENVAVSLVPKLAQLRETAIAKADTTFSRAHQLRNPHTM